MEELKSSEILELVALFEASIDVQFRVWVSITFAVVVASYASRGQLSKKIRWLMGGLYLLVVVAIFSRWLSDSFRVIQLIEILETRNIDMGVIAIAPISRISTFFLGSIVALYVLYYYGKENLANVHTTE